MVGWHHWLNGHEFEQTLGDGEGLGRLLCYSSWGRKESDTTDQLNSNSLTRSAKESSLSESKRTLINIIKKLKGSAKLIGNGKHTNIHSVIW